MATANDLTRQQLDELDALLQRMLNVPATKVESPAPSTTLSEPPSGWRVDPPAPVGAPHRAPVFAELARAKANVEIPNLGEAPQPFAPSPMQPLARAKASAFVPPLEMEAPPLPEEFTALDLAELTPIPMPIVGTPEREETPGLSPMLWPLFVVNWILESILSLFGPPGEMLTRRFAKNMLGAAGVLLMIGAGLWAAQGQGWLKLPMGR